MEGDQAAQFINDLRHADALNHLRLQLKLKRQSGRSQDLSAGTENFAIL